MFLSTFVNVKIPAPSVTCFEGTEGVVEVYFHTFLVSTLNGEGGQRHAPATLFPGRRLGTYRRRGWVGYWAGLDGRGEEKISGPYEGPNPESSIP